ncbi:MAG: rhomboid family intramembrane serine protease [Planctomycetota bacterium]|nr:MAG: rhomboid family intramembrane serine protease [Planctomycetota bacterium]
MKKQDWAKLLPSYHLAHMIAALVLVLNFFRTICFYFYDLDLYLYLSLQQAQRLSLSYENYLQLFTYPFAMPFFSVPLHSILTLYGFWWLGKELLERMGPLRFTVYFFFCSSLAGLLHLYFHPGKEFLGLSASLAGLIVASWWYFPTRELENGWKIKYPILLVGFLWGIYTYFLTHPKLEFQSHLWGAVAGGVLVQLEYRFIQIAGALAVLFRRWRQYKESYIQRKLDQILSKISHHGLSSLSPLERFFLRYASKHYRQQKKSKSSSSPSPDKALPPKS